jgi:hypothetical protein
MMIVLASPLIPPIEKGIDANQLGIVDQGFTYHAGVLAHLVERSIISTPVPDLLLTCLRCLGKGLIQLRLLTAPAEWRQMRKDYEGRCRVVQHQVAPKSAVWLAMCRHRQHLDTCRIDTYQRPLVPYFLIAPPIYQLKMKGDMQTNR